MLHGVGDQVAALRGSLSWLSAGPGRGYGPGDFGHGFHLPPPGARHRAAALECVTKNVQMFVAKNSNTG